MCLALGTASDEEEGAGLFDSAGKAAADPFDTSSGSVQLIAIKPSALPVVHPASDRGPESSAALNGEVSAHSLGGESSWTARVQRSHAGGVQRVSSGLRFTPDLGDGKSKSSRACSQHFPPAMTPFLPNLS